MERIVNTELGVIREPLRAPFGFKGGTLSELWQTAVRLTLDSGASGMGVGVQSVLWSDPVTFCACDEAGGNERMLAVTRRALELLQGQAFTDPPGMTAGLVPELLAFARRLLGRADVPQTSTRWYPWILRCGSFGTQNGGTAPSTRCARPSARS